MSEASTVAVMSHENTISKWRAYVELTKPRITTMVLITVGVAAYVACSRGFKFNSNPECHDWDISDSS